MRGCFCGRQGFAYTHIYTTPPMNEWVNEWKHESRYPLVNVSDACTYDIRHITILFSLSPSSADRPYIYCRHGILHPASMLRTSTDSNDSNNRPTGRSIRRLRLHIIASLSPSAALPPLVLAIESPPSSRSMSRTTVDRWIPCYRGPSSGISAVVVFTGGWK